KAVLPCEVKEIKRVQRHTELQEWLQSANWATNVHASGQQQLRRQYGRDRSPAGGPQQNRPTPEQGSSADRPFSNLPDDLGFEAAELQVAVGALRDGRVLVAAQEAGGDVPLIVSSPRG